MKKIAEIKQTKRGTVKVEFSLNGIYDILKNTLGFRYSKINGKGYYLKENDNRIFEVVGFHHLSDSFRKFIRDEFSSLFKEGEISYVDFMNEYYERIPIKNGNSCKEYLSDGFSLTDSNVHLIRMNVDYKYNREFKCQELIDFLVNEKFIETIDKIGNFGTNKPLFYKRQSDLSFLVFNRPFVDETNNDCTFDFWQVNVKSEKEFLSKRLKDDLIIDLRLGFDLERDIELYKEKIENVC